MVRVEAPAKLNLFLAVGSRDPDGFHPVETLMQAVSLADELDAQPAPEIILEIEPPGAAPVGEENLAVTAAGTLATATGISAGVRMRLRKRIPLAAGLGGGSADAAAALVALNELWGAGVSRKALGRIASAIGADVPFCLQGGAAFGSGRGDQVTPLPAGGPVWWVLGIAAGGLSTAEVYRGFDERAGGPAPILLGDLPELAGLADALARGDAGRAAGLLRNDLEPAACDLRSGLADGRAAFVAAGALGVVLSGSGPTWCGLCRDEPHAREIAARLADAFDRVEVVRSVTHGARLLRRA